MTQFELAPIGSRVAAVTSAFALASIFAWQLTPRRLLILTAARSGRVKQLVEIEIESAMASSKVDLFFEILPHGVINATLIFEILGQSIASYAGAWEMWRARTTNRFFYRIFEQKAVFVDDGISPAEVFATLDSVSRVNVPSVVETFERVVVAPRLLSSFDCAGRTLLMKAVQIGAVKTAAALLAARADPNAQGGNGWTALHFAAVGRIADMCSLLLDHRAAVDSRSRDGYSALFYAQQAGSETTIIDLLLRRGATPCSLFDSRCVGEP